MDDNAHPAGRSILKAADLDLDAPLPDQLKVNCGFRPRSLSFFELATDRVMGRKHNERGPRAVDRDV